MIVVIIKIVTIIIIIITMTILLFTPTMDIFINSSTDHVQSFFYSHPLLDHSSNHHEEASL